ncbi:MAG: GntR family transcriptional regulator [Qingshengfaniella sp.]
MPKQNGTRTHTMRAQIELRQRILNGELTGGTRVYEVTLAEELQISRTPAREAMARLVEEGLLERGSRGGFTVRSFNYADVVDTIELRGVLEGTAARLAAERGVPADLLDSAATILDEIDASFGPATGDVDFAAYSAANARFHQTLADMSGSAVMQLELARITRLPFAAPSAFLPFRLQSVDFKLELLDGQRQHRRILDAITNREGARAESLAREHARAARINIGRIFGRDGKISANIPALALIAPPKAAMPSE